MGQTQLSEMYPCSRNDFILHPTNFFNVGRSYRHYYSQKIHFSVCYTHRLHLCVVGFGLLPWLPLKIGTCEIAQVQPNKFCLYTGWFEHKTQISLRCQYPRRFFGLDSECFAHVFIVPLPSLERVAFFFRQVTGLVYFSWKFETPYFRRKKQKQNPFVKGSARGKLSTCAQFQGLPFKYCRGCFVFFVRISAKIVTLHRHCFVFVYFKFWALNVTYYWSCAIHFLILCTKLGTYILLSTWTLVLKKHEFCFSSYSKCLSKFHLVESLWLIGTNCRC